MRYNTRRAPLRASHSAHTVRLRMAADQERADRIRALKQDRPDLTWRRIADHVGVTERSAADWQVKGGIDYTNAEKLAELFEVDVDYIWRGPVDTPDLSRPDPQTEWMTRMEALIDRQNDLLERQSLILERIEARLEATVEQETRAADHIEAATGSLDQSAADLDAAVRRTISGLESAPRSKRPAAKKTAAHRTPRAAK
jgi:isopentenyldiphosphate isomerase